MMRFEICYGLVHHIMVVLRDDVDQHLLEHKSCYIKHNAFVSIRCVHEYMQYSCSI